MRGEEGGGDSGSRRVGLTSVNCLNTSSGKRRNTAACRCSASLTCILNAAFSRSEEHISSVPSVVDHQWPMQAAMNRRDDKSEARSGAGLIRAGALGSAGLLYTQAAAPVNSISFWTQEPEEQSQHLISHPRCFSGPLFVFPGAVRGEAGERWRNERR